MNAIVRKQYFFLVVSFLLCIGSGVGIGLLLSRMNHTVIRTGEIKERLMSYEVNKKAFEDEAVEIQSLESRLSLLEQSIIQTASIPTLLSQLESLAETKKALFEITSVQTALEGGASTLVIEGIVRGTYAQVMSVLDAIEHQPFQVRFRRIALSSEEVPPAPIVPSDSLAAVKPPIRIEQNSWKGIITLEIISFK